MPAIKSHRFHSVNIFKINAESPKTEQYNLKRFPLMWE